MSAHAQQPQSPAPDMKRELQRAFERVASTKGEARAVALCGVAFTLGLWVGLGRLQSARADLWLEKAAGAAGLGSDDMFVCIKRGMSDGVRAADILPKTGA